MVVEPIEKKEVLIKDNEAKLNLYAKVLAVGPDVKYTQVGDYISFDLWGLTDKEINGKMYYFVSEVEGISLTGIPKSWIE